MRTMSLLLTMLFLSFCVLSLNATIIHVPDDQPTIQVAINAAVDGDTVLVSPGTYEENINFEGRGITVCSLFLTTGDPSFISSTIIDGNASGSAVTIPSSKRDLPAALNGFTIRDGYSETGAGIFCTASNALISSNVLEFNIAFEFAHGKGGGIYCGYSSPIIRDNLFRQNVASGYYGGYGGGAYLLNSDAKLSGNIFIGNLGDGWGGAIFCSGSNPVMDNNVIVQNEATASGGGIFCSLSNPVMNKNTLSGNDAVWDIGGGMYCEDSSPLISNTIFWGDSSFYGASEIVIESGSPEITYSDVEGGWPGDANIDIDPLFTDPEDDDYTLLPGSPCIDAGNPDTPCVPWGGWRLDMGAHEFDRGFYWDGEDVILKPFPLEWPPLDESE